MGRKLCHAYRTALRFGLPKPVPILFAHLLLNIYIYIYKSKKKKKNVTIVIVFYYGLVNDPLVNCDFVN